jgi:hypothetical protein
MCFIKTFIFCLLINYCHSQITILNHRLFSPETPVAIVQHTNLLSINGIEHIDSSLYLTIKNGTITTYDSLQFLLTPTKVGMDTLKLYLQNQLIYSYPIQIKSPTPITCFFGSIRDSVTTTKHLLNNLFLEYGYESNNIVPTNLISEFTAVTIKKNGKIKKLHAYSANFKIKYDKNGDEYSVITGKKRTEFTPGNSFGKNQIRKIKQLKSGDQLCIQLIKIVGESCPRIVSVDKKIMIRNR